MSVTVNAAQIVAGLKILAGFNAEGAIAAFEGQDTQAKIVNGLMLADDAAKLVGLFFPPVAVIANDVSEVIAIEQFAYPLVVMIDTKFPFVPPPNTTEAWGVTVSDKGLFQ